MSRKMVAKNIKAEEATLTIALVFTRDRGYTSDALQGIRRYARGCNNWALVSVFPRERLAETLASLKPAGIIVNDRYKGIEDILHKVGRPVVSVNPGLADHRFSQVTRDAASIGAMAAKHLLECGLRNFGYFGPPWSGPTCEREGGFCQTLSQHLYEVATCYVRPPGSGSRSGTFATKKNVCRWIAKLPKPAGIFAPNDMWALWLCGVCKQEGIKVPEDIAIVGAGNDELLCELSQPTLSSVAIPAERIGYEAAAMLDGLIHGESVSDKPLLLPAIGVVTRQSTDILAVTDSGLVTALDYIRKHISEPIVVEDVLRQTRLPRRSFERKFREALGRSPAQEIRHLRIAMAKNLLTSNTRTKTESIARRCGFTRAAHFSRAFHQATGMTPTDYRQTMIKEGDQENFAADSPDAGH
jgi:LacI family transcriptional regulator